MRKAETDGLAALELEVVQVLGFLLGICVLFKTEFTIKKAIKEFYHLDKYMENSSSFIIR